MSSEGSHPASAAARRRVVLGVCGGSGLYAMDALADARAVEVATPFGAPSGPYTVGELPRNDGPGVKAVFLPRHGAGHRKTPTEINYRANIHGFKQLGVTHLVSVSAVGSLREAIEPGHLVCVDQFIDRTRGRPTTFFGDGAVVHVQFGEPTDAALRGRLQQAAKTTGATVHGDGTLVVIEGPTFSTRAESELFRSWGAHVVGMTALPEARLAREAELSYCLLALSTDYDCWHTEEVSVASVMEVMAANVDNARKTIAALAAALPEHTEALPYPPACEGALMTAPEHLGADTRRKLDLLIGHYL
ncbi:MAG: S-methyl-5'-thioadenosine phosphorylase [Myxococcota bacterium]